MRKKLVYLATITATLGIGLSWGMVAGSRNMFPANVIRSAVHGQVDPNAQFRAHQADLQRTVGRKADVVIVGDSLLSDIPWGEIFPNVTSSAIRGSATADVVKRLPSIRATGASRTIVLIGINDIDDEVSRETTEANLAAIAKGLPGRITFVGLLPCHTMLRKCAKLRPDIARFNAHLASMAGGRISYLAPPSEIQAADTYDGLHLSASGAQKMVSLLAPIINEKRLPEK